MAEPGASLRDLDKWLTAEVARLVGVSPAAVDRDMPFRELGLSSVQAVDLVAMTEDRYGLALSPTLLFEHPTLSQVVAAIRDEAAGRSE
ncbi:acyl carrier protein [Salinactinospora qingdaonensis]|uniref:Carrier domain-containing protein n=1 Tax=Salinactinospora qingdaonensis TaxID=702744 RepID=A0ABP7FYB4_9ACTN